MTLILNPSTVKLQIRSPCCHLQVSDKCTPEDLVTMIDAFNPDNLPGRLAVVVRMGAAKLRAHLPSLIQAVEARGQVRWNFCLGVGVVRLRSPPLHVEYAVAAADAPGEGKGQMTCGHCGTSEICLEGYVSGSPIQRHTSLLTRRLLPVLCRW